MNDTTMRREEKQRSPSPMLRRHSSTAGGTTTVRAVGGIGGVGSPCGGVRRILSEKVARAARAGMRRASSLLEEETTGISRLRLSDLRLHGREDVAEWLETKLEELIEGGDYRRPSVATRGDYESRLSLGRGNEGREGPSTPEMLLVTGPSGVGKSALVARGLRDPAIFMGMAFAGGKFDTTTQAGGGAPPLSAFLQAMSSLTKHVLQCDQKLQIMEDIGEEFSMDEMAMIAGAMPECSDLFGWRLKRLQRSLAHQSTTSTSSIHSLKEKDENQTSSQDTTGAKASASQETPRRKKGARRRGSSSFIVARQQYAIIRLLRVICTSLKGLVLFIDDMQVRGFSQVGGRGSIEDALLVHEMSSAPGTHPHALYVASK